MTIEMQKFARANKLGMRFMVDACEDYYSARCSLLQRGFGGLHLGSLAIEKLLKSLMLFKEPELDVRKIYGHDMLKVFDDVVHCYDVQKKDQYRDIVNRFKEHYDVRYPCDNTQPRTICTGEYMELDDIFVGMYSLIEFPVGSESTGLVQMALFSDRTAKMVLLNNEPLRKMVKPLIELDDS